MHQATNLQRTDLQVDTEYATKPANRTISKQWPLVTDAGCQRIRHNRVCAVWQSARCSRTFRGITVLREGRLSRLRLRIGTNSSRY